MVGIERRVRPAAGYLLLLRSALPKSTLTALAPALVGAVAKQRLLHIGRFEESYGKLNKIHSAFLGSDFRTSACGVFCYFTND